MLKIAELTKDTGSVQLPVMLLDKQLLPKRNKASYYLQVTVGDNSGTLSFPIWASAEDKYDELEINKVYYCFAETGEYEGQVQLQKAVFSEFDEDYEMSDFIQAYQIPEEMFDYFKEVIKNLPEGYKKLVDNCLDTVGIKNFLIAPAALSHHHNKLAGLFYHTTGMLRGVDKIEELYAATDEDFNIHRLRTKVILHDIKKTAEYNYPKISYNDDCILDHLVMGAMLVQSVNDRFGCLPQAQIDNIAYGILAHHGQYGNYQPKTTEDTILHLLDMTDSRMVDQNGFVKHKKIREEPNTIDLMIKKALEDERDE